MSACASVSKSGKKGENIPDLEDIVQMWSKELFDMTKTSEQKRLPKEVLQFNLNWKNVHFNFDTPHYQMVPSYVSKENGPGKQQIQPQTLFRTRFANATAHEQEYSFKTERTTRSAATVALEQGFSRGAEFGLSLKTPGEILEANAGFKAEMSLLNIGEDTIEEEMTWGVDSMVHVPANTETTAELIVTEAQQSATFVMETRIWGRVLVSVTNLRDNNSIVTTLEGQIGDIMRHYVAKLSLKGFRVDRNALIVETKGKCDFRYGIEQRIRISEKPLKRGKEEKD